MPVWVLLAAPLFAWADRTVGGAGRRSVAFLAVLAFGIAAGVLAHLWGVLGLCLAWIAYRSLPWRIGGTTTPHGVQVIGSLARHLLPAFGAVITMLGGWSPLVPVYALVIYGVSATALSVSYATAIDRLIASGGHENGQVNARYELARGFIFGACLALGFLIQP